jgi:hypothetical protein
MKIEYIEQLSQLSEVENYLSSSPKIPPITPQVEADGAQLNDLLTSGDGSTVFSPAKVSEIQSVGWPLQPTHTLLDKALQRADDLGASFRSKVEHVTELIKAGPETYSLQTILLVESEMHTITLEMDLLSNGVHKTSQYIDQLSKIS